MAVLVPQARAECAGGVGCGPKKRYPGSSALKNLAWLRTLFLSGMALGVEKFAEAAQVDLEPVTFAALAFAARPPIIWSTGRMGSRASLGRNSTLNETILCAAAC
jgi:hypothetical protein